MKVLVGILTAWLCLPAACQSADCNHNGKDDVEDLSVMVDLDDDGKLDVAVTDPGVTIYRNDGDGAFSRGPSFPVEFPPLALVAGDLDGDGAPELISAKSGSGLSILLNRGDGQF